MKEVDESKKLWVKCEQYFIQKGSKCERMKNSLNLYFDENSLIRSKIRFRELTEMSHERKHPLLLRNNSYFKKLIEELRKDAEHPKGNSNFISKNRRNI